MGPLSAVAIAIALFLLGLTTGGWATISAKVMGVIYIVAAAIVLVDTFWHHFGPTVTRQRVVQE